jgi:formimidoylglutamate deiminase
MQDVLFDNLWVDGAWRTNALVSIDTAGLIRGISTDPARAPAAAVRIAGLTLPGLADAHCHAFQRAIPGWTQRAISARDTFWSWREIMYAAANALGAGDLEAIGARCYLDLLRGGYTEVAEFLYLHRFGTDPQARRAEDALLAAAAKVGIGLTLLPTLYQHAGFGPLPPTPRQRAFIRTTARYLEDWRALRERFRHDHTARLGIAFHSLRAVELDTIAAVRAELGAEAEGVPFHIHISEQRAEVEDCRRHYGLTPVALLASRALLDERWALVHATHASPEEMEAIAASGATVVLCPTTEADLGDGCSEAVRLLEAGGTIAIGSDSNVGTHALTELRQLEWSERLRRERRNVFASASASGVADRLFAAAHAGGWRALGCAGPLRRADFVTYDATMGDWAQHRAGNYLASLMFAPTPPTPRDVMVGGRRIIRDGVHSAEAEIDARYRAALTRLQGTLAHALE